MALSVINGATVTVIFGTAVVKIASLSITTGQGTFDISSFGSGNYVDRIGGGLRDLAGSAAGFLQAGSGDTFPSPFTLMDNATTMTLTFASGCILGPMPIIVGNVTVDVSRAGIGVVRFDWSKADSTDPTGSTLTWI